MSDKTAVITGATSGVGWGVARGLLAQGWRVVALARQPALAEEMHDGVEAVECDLASLASVRSSAARVLDNCPKIDALIGCAGVVFWKRRETADGTESTWATNVLGHALVAELLLPRLKVSAPSRIVMISGNAHRKAHTRWDDLELHSNYSAMAAGTQAALAKVLWTYAIAREIRGTGVTVNTFCPAFVKSGLTRDLPGWLKPFVSVAHLFAQTPEEGARTPLWLATDADIATMTGRFCRHSRVQPDAPMAAVEADQDRMLRVVRERIGHRSS